MAGTNPSTSTSSSTSLPSSTPDSLILLNLPISTKLNLNNFLAWQSQIVPLLHGYDLFKYVHSPTPPDPTITVGTAVQLNPSYVQWQKQDQLLLGWIRSSLSEPLLAQVVSCTTSASLWSMLHRTFSATSRARLVELQQQLQGITKGVSTCVEYIRKLRSIADELAFIGAPVPEAELVNYTLRGLGSDFNPLVLAVTARSDPISLPDLHSLLLTSETRLNSQHSLPSLPAVPDPPAVFYSNPRPRFPNPNPRQYSPHPYPFRPSGSRPPFSQNPRPNNPFPQFHNRPPPLNPIPRPTNFVQNFNPRQPAPQPQPLNDGSPCQICGRRNHQARECYHRFQNRYLPNQPPPNRPQHPTYQAFVAQPSSYTAPHEWCIDSGATHHVTPDLNNLSSFVAFDGQDTLQIGNGMDMTITHIGNFSLNFSNFSIALHDVLHVPHFTRNLLSLSKLLLDNSLLIEFSSNSCQIKDRQTKTLLIQAPLISGLYILTLPSTLHSPKALHGARVSANLWHARFGHPSSSTTLELLNKFSLPCSLHKMSLCSECCMAKSHKLPFASRTSLSRAPLELVHSDLWGPSPVLSKDGYRYYVIFVDDFTHFTWLYFLRTKDELPKVFSLFKQQVENLLNHTIKILRTDGGTEYKPLSRLFPQITYQTTCPYTPQQNGLAERMHRHIVELSLATMTHASIPLQFWDEIFASIVYLINRLPSSSTKLIPFQQLFNTKPDYTFLRVLGCLCFPYLRPYNDHKLQHRSLPCVFIGYAYHQKGYKCLHIPTNKIYISRHVIFDEIAFPFSSSSRSDSEAESISMDCTSMGLQPLTINSSVQSPAHNLMNSTQASTPAHSPSAARTLNLAADRTPLAAPSDPPAPSSPSTLETPLLTIPSAPVTSLHPMTTRTRDNTRKPRVFTDHVALNSSSFLESEPTNFLQANKSSIWRDAMSREIDALAQNQTWTLVPAPSDHNIVGCKWVYRIKRNADGSIERYKARLVAKGFTQEEGIDFFDTFSPVIRPMTIRLVLSLALSLGWTIKQLDVQNAFLHGNLQETVYMSQPPGFVDPSYPSHVCRLNKALYGLKQSPRAWFHTLSSALIDYGFCASNYDPSLFVYHHNGSKIVVLVYVDDIIITGDSPILLSKAIAHLNSQFAIKDLGSLKFFLGIEVHSISTGFLLTQTKYLKNILTRANMLLSKPTASPMVVHTSLSLHEGDPMDNPSLYRTIVGALQYATITRPDIAFAVNKVSQFMHSPTNLHWEAVKRILRYLNGTLTYGLTLKPAINLVLHAYSDSDWAGCPDDRRSTSGYAIFLGPNLISWSAKKQATVSRSSTEAEYRALALASAELVWLQFLLHELHITCSSSPILWCDNIGATFLASNPMFHARTKHVEIDYHFIREKVQNKELEIKFICSKDQLADIMTKPLTTPRFVLLRDKLNVTSVPFACGGAVTVPMVNTISDIANQRHEDHNALSTDSQLSRPAQ
ncbi:hypothetical protein LUZ62_030694 [Rhynchospora pubera]|uniref:Integrase catalytic domain-containing protein n=1 Tax=Rhynchospora pubera TaxID=906938 RepID=A0AAV8HJR7_9POAL|nr:hypothetical protein LUZ62_030694 [Rhynchospora pubera]